MSEAVFRAHFEQIWNQRDASAIARFIAPTYRGFEADELIAGVAGYTQHFETLTTAFPDLRLTIDVLFAAVERDASRVAARYVAEATHTGPLGTISPTGRRVRVTGSALVRITNRQLVEEYANADTLGLLRQLGVVPEIATVTLPPLLF
jgi:predicted ester cyclase